MALTTRLRPIRMMMKFRPLDPQVDQATLMTKTMMTRHLPTKQCHALLCGIRIAAEIEP